MDVKTICLSPAAFIRQVILTHQNTHMGGLPRAIVLSAPSYHEVMADALEMRLVDPGMGVFSIMGVPVLFNKRAETPMLVGLNGYTEPL
jgi:hypothetical protein